MKIEIPKKDWVDNLVNVLRDCGEGDIIVVHDENMKMLAERAYARMSSKKVISFEILDKN
jgi:hypothetical protein